MYLGLAILRVPEGLDYSQIIEDDDTPVVINESGLTQLTDDKATAKGKWC